MLTRKLAMNQFFFFVESLPYSYSLKWLNNECEILEMKQNITNCCPLGERFDF